MNDTFLLSGAAFLYHDELMLQTISERGEIIPSLKTVVPKNRLFSLTGTVLLRGVGTRGPARWAGICPLHVGIGRLTVFSPV